jgi:hypothetical protein
MNGRQNLLSILRGPVTTAYLDLCIYVLKTKVAPKYCSTILP